MHCVCGCKQQWHMNGGIARPREYETSAEAEKAWEAEKKHYTTRNQGTPCLSPGCDCREFQAVVTGALASRLTEKRA